MIKLLGDLKDDNKLQLAGLARPFLLLALQLIYVVVDNLAFLVNRECTRGPVDRTRIQLVSAAKTSETMTNVGTLSWSIMGRYCYLADPRRRRMNY
jgi:hypothetical protein